MVSAVHRALLLATVDICLANFTAECDAGAGESTGPADDSVLLQAKTEFQHPGEEVFTLCDADWVICADAVCEEPVDGVARCTCYKQAKSPSILPSSYVGAPPLLNISGGREMCRQMKAGKLYSTFWSNTSYYPSMSFAVCPPKTSFAYCWGAPCSDSSSNPEEAICSCPMASSKTNIPQRFPIQTALCPPATRNPCSLTMNAGITAMFVAADLVELVLGVPLDVCYRDRSR